MSDYTPHNDELKFFYERGFREFGKRVLDRDYADCHGSFDRWLARRDKYVAAAAWEEGFNRAQIQHHDHNMRRNRHSPAIVIDNPYRREDQK